MMESCLLWLNLLADLLPNYWEEAPVERYLTRRMVTFLAEEGALAIDFRTRHYAQPPYNGFTLLRPKFDRWLASKAEKAGALLITSTVVDDLRYERGQIAGVQCRREDGELYAPVVIAADGANSFLAKKAGLQHEFRADEMTLVARANLNKPIEAAWFWKRTTGHAAFTGLPGGSRGGAPGANGPILMGPCGAT